MPYMAKLLEVERQGLLNPEQLARLNQAREAGIVDQVMERYAQETDQRRPAGPTFRDMPGGRHDPYRGDARRDAAILGTAVSMIPVGGGAVAAGRGAATAGPRMVQAARSAGPRLAKAAKSKTGRMAVDIILDSLPFGHTGRRVLRGLLDYSRRRGSGGAARASASAPRAPQAVETAASAPMKAPRPLPPRDERGRFVRDMARVQEAKAAAAPVRPATARRGRRRSLVSTGSSRGDYDYVTDVSYLNRQWSPTSWRPR